MRWLLVHGVKTFRIEIPDDAQVTFGPWSPPPRGRGQAWTEGDKIGTLRIYDSTKKTVLALFSGVTSFRDLSIGYAEQVAREEGATIWKDDEKGYTREHNIKSTKEWLLEPVPLPPSKKSKK